MKKSLLTLCLFVISILSVNAQTGEVQGRVTDEKGEPVPFALVVVVRDIEGKQLTSKGTKTDANGFYTLKGMNPGTYNIMAKSVGKPNMVEVGVQVYAGRPVTLNFSMEQKSNTIKTVDITAKAVAKKPPIIDVFKPKETVFGKEEIKDAAVRDISTIAASAGGVVQSDVGQSLTVGGGRDNGLTYFINGVKITGNAPNVPVTQIAQMEVITSGVPAKYGDANAGVINIITTGPTDKLMGSVSGITSQFLDPYGYNLGNFNLTGPILRRKSTIDSTIPGMPQKIKGESFLGFSIGGEYEYLGDKYPTRNGNWKVKDNIYDSLLNNPYTLSSTGDQLLLTQSFLKLSDLEETNSHQNTSGRNIRLNGTLDWKVIPNSTNITLGARVENLQYNFYVQRYSLLNYQNNPIYTDKSYNAYIRLYQPLFNSDKQEKKWIKNTTFTLQFDATLSGQDFESPIGKQNPWYYGYIGKFTETRAYDYTRSSAADGTKVYYAPNQYLVFNDFVTANSSTPIDVSFETSDINPVASRQTKQFIDYYNNTIGKTDKGRLASVSAIESAQGIVNGMRANITVHDLFYPAARVYNGFQKEENLQFRSTGTFNFDIMPTKAGKKDFNKHTIEMGFELEQRVNRKYSINPLTLWSVAQSTYLNSHLVADNTNNFNPLLIMRDGQVRMRLQDYMNQDTIAFASFDTLLYDNEVSNGTQSNFSRNLRNDLFGGDSLKRININELDPNSMKLEWFSADELYNNSLVNTYGYDVYGNQTSLGTKFQDFFTAKDEKGNYTRQMAPFMPRYGAGYIQDRFQLKDLSFNVGFRIDYFDPNTYTLRDPYVPQGGRTIADVSRLNDVDVSHPLNLPSNAVVYVDKAVDPTKITGYRVGSQWYDKKGNELSGPNAIEVETGSNVQPFLIGNNDAERAKRDMNSTTFDPDLMFKKTSGQFAFSPRLNFTFQIDTHSLIFAHYDVLNQRPEQDATIVTPINYYNLLQRRNTSFINNPDLGFSTTTDLELGFKQALTPRSSLTVNFQYREYSNLVAYGRVNGAYPGSYNTFMNTDFTTYKSIGLAFEQRRINNLRLKANYTLSFMDGTGSSRTAQVNLLNAGLGSLKTIFPLNNDTRHNINFSANYRFDSRDPRNRRVWAPLKDFGINIDLNLRSGVPYTQQVNATPEAFMSSATQATTLGDINAGRLPWRFNVNLKADKDINFKFGKRDSTKSFDSRREYSLNIYVQITNLLNAANALSVYRYTGSPATDGYLTSPNGILDYTNKETTAVGLGQAFRDLYNIALDIPDNRNSMYVRPRVIQLGVTLSF